MTTTSDPQNTGPSLDKSAATGGATRAPKDKLDARVLKIAGVVVIGSIMAILDMTVVGVAQNTFQATWGASPALAAWTITAYTLALAAVIPVTGWAADRFGTKRLYLISILLFVGGSVLCATAWDIGPLIVFRAIQGLGGGMLMPLGMTILTKAAGPERVGRVMAVLGIPMLLGPIGGPILGGWLIDAVSWHWIFLINLPIGVIGLVYAALVLPKDNPTPSESFDVLGFALLSPGLAAFLFGVSSIPEAGTIASPKVLIWSIAGLVLIVAFVLHALRKTDALIDLHLFKNRQLTFAILTMAMFAIAFFGAMFIFPQYFIGVRGETPMTAGLLGAPMGIGAMLTMPLAGALTDKFGPGKFVMTGLVLIVIGLIPMTMLGVDTSYWVTSGAFFVMGLGMGMTMMPTMTAALKTLRDHQIARGSTLTNITQQVAASIGTAVISVLLTNFLKKDPTAGLAILSNADPVNGPAMLDAVAQQQGVPADALQLHGLTVAADAFGSTSLIALILVALTLIPAFFLPRKRQESTVDPAAAAAMMH
ncbi:DHA2 family efflux MFS transporter permease subunit [Nakamurella lactea]|uniref:DHA2 family efflux MFS transporter permease subunit n=1 Tax=Nakamurella lactea TaxID=459515 RepID=UPI0004248D65|nr:DHA2 family efflux MFS transporter permease subunit [Nakamurella lactea]